MGEIYRKCRLVPHNLSEPQNSDRLRQSHELLAILQDTKGICGRFILTENESWFLYVNERGKLWLSPGSDVPEVAWRLINISKVMIPLFWNPAGLQVSDFLASESFNGDHIGSKKS
jgi:hypothetical protein